MSSRSRGGKFLETAHVHEKERVKRGIGSKFPELGAMQPERDDCDPPLVVCGRCAVCGDAAARQLAVLATRLPSREASAGLRTSLLALGILTEDGDEPGTEAAEERTA